MKLEFLKFFSFELIIIWFFFLVIFLLANTYFVRAICSGEPKYKNTNIDFMFFNFGALVVICFIIFALFFNFRVAEKNINKLVSDHEFSQSIGVSYRSHEKSLLTQIMATKQRNISGSALFIDSKGDITRDNYIFLKGMVDYCGNELPPSIHELFSVYPVDKNLAIGVIKAVISDRKLLSDKSACPFLEMALTNLQQ